MNIFLTGAAGFIGSNLAETLCEEHLVTGIDNFDPFYSIEHKRKNVESAKMNRNFTFYESDILDQDFLNSLMKKDKFDIILHFAAKAGVRPSIQDPQAYSRTNIDGTVSILEAAKKNGIEHVIFASSSSVYGNSAKFPLQETDNVDHPISQYAATKKAGELMCSVYSTLFGMKIAALRLFTVYGRRQRPDLAIAKFTDLIRSGNPIPVFGDGTTERDYTYIDDIISGVQKAIQWLTGKDAGYFDVFNIGGGRTVRLIDLIHVLETNLGKTAEIDFQPKQPGDVDKTFADISKASKNFGYSPTTPIESGVEKYIRQLPF